MTCSVGSRIAIPVVLAAIVVASCSTGQMIQPQMEHPVVMVLYPDVFRVDDNAASDVDAVADSLRTYNRARTLEVSEAFSVDPDRAAVLRYARYADEDTLANDLEHRLGSRIWNSTYTVLSFTLGDAMVHLDTTMKVRTRASYEAAQVVQAQYVIAIPSVELVRPGAQRQCRVRMQMLHVPTQRVLVDTVITTSDSGLATRTSFIRGGTWVSAIDAAAATISEIPTSIIKRTLPRYVRRDSIMDERRAWFHRNLWSQRVDADLLTALSADTLQPSDAKHRWMLRSPDGSKALVSTATTFGGTVGLRFMRGAQGVIIYPRNQRDTARCAFTLYALEKVDGVWYWDRVRTTFKNERAYDDEEHLQFTFDALKTPWYLDAEGVPRGEFWERDFFRRVDGVPMLKYIRQQFE